MDGTTTYTYDSENRLIKEACGRDVTYYVYNDLDEVIVTATLQETYEGDIPESYDSALTCFDTISYTYDNGMVMQVQDGTIQVVSTMKKGVSVVTKLNIFDFIP